MIVRAEKRHIEAYDCTPAVTARFDNQQGGANALLGVSLAVAHAAAAELGVPFLDLFTPLAADRRYLDSLQAADGVHPDAAGYAVIAEQVGRWPAWRAWFDGG